MALGSGSSLATDCWRRRRGSPFSLQLCSEGKADLLHQLSSQKPTAQESGCSAAILINRSRRLFSRILRIWGSDPAFGPLPAHSQARKRCPDALARDLLFGEPFFEADLGGHLQSPKATLFAEFARVLMKQLAQSLSLLSTLESPVNSMRRLRTWLKRFRESLLVESVDGVARRLRIAAQFVSDLVGVFAPVASEQDLATAQGEGIRRAQACLQGLTLGVDQRTHEYWSFHRVEDNHQLPSCLERHYRL